MWSRQVVRLSLKRLERSSSPSAFMTMDRLAAGRRTTVGAATTTSSSTFNGTTVRNFSISDYGKDKVKTSFDLIDPAEHDGHSLTKIVATIGPTSEQLEPLSKVVKSGMKIMRLNFSHATTEEVELRLKNLAASQVRLIYIYVWVWVWVLDTLVRKRRLVLSPFFDSFNESLFLFPGNNTKQDKYDDLGGLIDTMQDVRATLLDTRGPEIRCGKLAHDDSGHETISLVKGESITLQTKAEYSEAGTTTDLFINYNKLHECLHPGMKVLLDDGAVILTVTDINYTDGSVVCSIDNSGELRSRAGVNLPMAETELPAMSEKDKKDIKYGLEIDVDYVAASFIQTPEAVREIRDYMKETAKELGWDDSRPLPLIISKIESASALKHFDEILEESDGIMVARGDLGVEIPIQVRPSRDCFLDILDGDR